LGGYSLRGSTLIARFLVQANILTYTANAHANNVTTNYRAWGSTSASDILVPYGFTDSNPAFTSDFTPVLKGCSYSVYLTDALPLDMGLHFPLTTTTFAFGDTIIVDAGVEEWEVLNFANNSIATAPNPLLVARVV
jgi:hypothetical protein